MAEMPTKAGTSPVGSSAGPQLTMTEDSDNKGDMYEAMDMLDAEGDGRERHPPEADSDSDSDGDPRDIADDNDEEEGQGHTASLHTVGHSPAEMDNAAPGPRRSTPHGSLVRQGPQGSPGQQFRVGGQGWLGLDKAAGKREEARARPDWPLWQQGVKDDVMAQMQLGTWSNTKMRNKNQQTVKTRFVFDIKHDAEGNLTRYKARLVPQGFNQVPGRDFDETWAPVPNAATTSAIFAVAAANDWEIHHVDIKTAFLDAKIGKDMYNKLPDGVEDGDPGEICQLNLALHGTKQAKRLRGMKLEKDRKKMGAFRPPVDPCVYEWNHPVHGRVFILVCADNLIVAGKILAGVQAVKSAVSGAFDVRDVAEVIDFIGIKVMRDRKACTITLRNRGLTAALLEALGMEIATPSKTPLASGVKLSKMRKDLLPEGNCYAAQVRSLICLSTVTRPDISIAVGGLPRFMSCLEEAHLRAAKGVPRYLRGTTRRGVAYVSSEPLQGYVDADWEGDVHGRRSTTRFTSTVSGGPVALASKRQSAVATSTAEAEYEAAAMATKEALWLHELLGCA